MTFPKTPSLSSLLRRGVGDIIEQIIDSRYIGIFSSYQQIIGTEKIHLGIMKKINLGIIKKNIEKCAFNFV